MTKSKKNDQHDNNKNPDQLDPHHAREAENYAKPIASREFILAHLNERHAPATHKDLVNDLALSDPDDIEALRRRLIAMCRDGQLVCNRNDQYLPSSKVNLKKGVVIGHRDGFGFVKLDEGGPDFYLSARQMQTVFDGDRVLVREDNGEHKGKTHAVIVDVLERNTEQLVGRLFREGSIAFVEVENTRISQQILVDTEHTGGAEHGQYVVVKIVNQPTKRTHATGKVIEVLGDHMAPGMEIEVAIRSYNIPFQWPAAVEQAVKLLKPEVSEADKQQRIDIRHLPLVTIDGEDARDFDDAVYCEAKHDGGWKLYVAIADVSHYVKPDSPLDIEANNRATSVYFPDHVVPMLPEILSNGLCSLNPKVDRLCMVCEMDVSAQGLVENSRFYEGLMNSKARLTYTKVSAILEAPESDDGRELREDYAKVVPHLENLYALYHAFLRQRHLRGAIDFDTVETRIIFGDERKIEAIVPTVRNDAHKLIEECMLAANVATAHFLKRHKLATLYRIHEGPTQEKLENARAFFSEQGLQLMGGDSPSPSDYQKLIEQIKDRPDFSVLQTVLLRSMSQAIYGPEEIGHFGLAFDAYAHFTSPIRRYPDLLVHRGIKSIIYSKQDTPDVLRPEGLDHSRYRYPYDLAKMLVLGEHCSMAERRADEATRDVMNWLKCEYLQQHVGEMFPGIISAVTGFGFFVELADLYAEGLVHVSTLKSDYYQFDHQKHRLIGERTGTSYSMGDRVVVEVSNINLEDRKVDLTLISAEPKSKARRRVLKKADSRHDKDAKSAKGAPKNKADKRTKSSDKKVKSKTTPSPKSSRKSATAPTPSRTAGVRKRKVKKT